MWHIQKINPLSHIAHKKYIAFIGAGGKSSLIEYLAQETSARHTKTAITTTTKIYAREPYKLLSKEVLKEATPDNVIRIGKTLENGKLTALTFDDLLNMGKTFDTILFEADGAKGKPLKYPAPYEPVIPPFSEVIFVVAGLDGLFGRIRDNVFRWELLEKACGLTGDEIISSQIFELFFTNRILFKNAEKEHCVVVLNKYDMFIQKQSPFTIAKAIMRKTGLQRVIVSSVAYHIFYEVRLFGP